MQRHELTDEQFEKIKYFLPGREGYIGATAKDNKLFINGVLWIFKTGAPWRDLPERYGHWKNIHRRFSRWSKTGVFNKIFLSTRQNFLAGSRACARDVGKGGLIDDGP